MDPNLLFSFASYLNMGLRWLGVPYWLCDLLLLNVGLLTMTLGLNHHQKESEGTEERGEGVAGLTEGKRKGNRPAEGEMGDRERDVRRGGMNARREEKRERLKEGEREEKDNEGEQREGERDVRRGGRNTRKEEKGEGLEEDEIEEKDIAEKRKDDETVFQKWEMDGRRGEKGRQQGEMGTHSSSSSISSSLQSPAYPPLPSPLSPASSPHCYCPHSHLSPRCGPTHLPYSPFKSFPPKSHPFLHFPCPSRHRSAYPQSHSSSSSSSLSGEMGGSREGVRLDLSEWSDGVVHLSVWPREAQVFEDRCGSQVDDEATWVEGEDSSLSSAGETCGWDKLEPCPLNHSYNLPPPLQNFGNHRTGLEDLENTYQNLQNNSSAFENVENHPTDFGRFENDEPSHQNGFIAFENLQNHSSVSEDLRKREKDLHTSSIPYESFINENKELNNLFTGPRNFTNLQTSSTPSGNNKNQEENVNNYPESPRTIQNHPRTRTEEENTKLKTTPGGKIEVENNTNLTTPKNKEVEGVEKSLTPPPQPRLTPLRAPPLPGTANQPPPLAPLTPSEPRVAKVRAEEALRERFKAQEFARRESKK